MLGENGYPLTPDWIPESRDGEVRHPLKIELNEALAAWDGDWTTWNGDQA